LLILVLVYLGYNYSKYELTFKKSPFIEGSGFSMIDWAKGGLYNFYLIRNDTYFYKDTNAPGASGKTTPEKQKQFLELVTTLRTPSFKPIVDNFCSAVQPCSKITPCGCKGALACPSNQKELETFLNVNVEHFGAGSAARASSTDRKHKMKTMKKFFAIIPKCCCVLSKKLSSGDDNPNYWEKFISSSFKGPEELGCSTGAETITDLNNTIKASANTPGSATASATGEIEAADLLAEDDPCSKVDCAKEPSYLPLTLDVFDGNGGLTTEHINKSKQIQTAIIANTPAAIIAAAYQNSTFNNGPSSSELGAILNVDNIKLERADTINNTNNNSLLDAPYTNIISDETKVKVDPKTNVAFKEPPAPPKGENSSGFSNVPKRAKKIKKNKQ
jgi:hypothetical protein